MSTLKIWLYLGLSYIGPQPRIRLQIFRISPMTNLTLKREDDLDDGPVEERDAMELEGALERVTSASSNNRAVLHQVDAAPKALPFSLSFMDPELADARKVFLKTMIVGGVLCSLVIFCVLSIYWGALYKIPDHKLDGWLVVRLFCRSLSKNLELTCQDFDGSTLGKTVVDAFAADTGHSARVVWKIMDPDHFDGDPAEVSHLILEQKAWVAVVGMSHFSCVHISFKLLQCMREQQETSLLQFRIKMRHTMVPKQ